MAFVETLADWEGKGASWVMARQSSFVISRRVTVDALDGEAVVVPLVVVVVPVVAVASGAVVVVVVVGSAIVAVDTGEVVVARGKR